MIEMSREPQKEEEDSSTKESEKKKDLVGSSE
jgi:hypothetical protein